MQGSSEHSFVGHRNGRLTVVGRVFPAKCPVLWRCKCDCGKYRIATAKDIKRSTKTVQKSCGCANREHAKKLAANLKTVDLTNKRFGRWLVLSLSDKRLHGCKVWQCKCDCGTIRDVASSSLLQKRSVSCGCYQREIAPELALHMSKHRRSSIPLNERSRAALTSTIRYARLKDATPSWVSKKELRQIYANCPEGYHVDHIHPLKHARLCGLHVPWNLQYLPASDNLKKYNSVDF